MNKWWAIVFLISLLGQTFSKCFIVLNFTLNRATIAATLCENRAKPKSCCKGSCYLGKQLAKDAKQQSAPLNGGENKVEVVLFAETVDAVQYPATAELLLLHNIHYCEIVPQQALISIFHPPQAYC